MVIPRIFSNERERTLASYDYLDIASGAGFVKYYGFNTGDSVGTEYGLSAEKVYSDDVETDVTALTTSYVKKLDLDFDTTTFNLPQTVKGDVIINVTTGARHNSGNTLSTYVIAKVRKWDGATETEIANTQSETWAVVSNNVQKSNTFTFKVTVAKTLFKKGETLRITFEVWAKASGVSASAITTIAHSPFDNVDDIDPSSQDSVTTQLLAFVPFEVDV